MSSTCHYRRPDSPCVLQTERLILRSWEADDLVPFSKINRDPEVMRHFPATLTPEESRQLIDRITEHFGQHGFGLWAVEPKGTPGCIGFTGLAIPGFEAAFTPCVEIGWRLARKEWGKGLASEGAREVARYAFEDLDLEEIVSFTVPGNFASRRVMEKLGMTYDPRDDFDHPRLSEGHPLRRHVLYRLNRTRWEAARIQRKKS